MVRRLTSIALLLLALTSCTVSHNYPPTPWTVVAQPGQHQVPTRQVFVDANGTFYPTDGTESALRRQVARHHSILNALHDPAQVNRWEAQQLADLASFVRDKRRIFVFVHGYNNTVAQARSAYTAIENRIAFAPGDGIIHFYWDGLTGRFAGPLKIWFNAAGYSQMAGSRGLRRILAQISDKPVHIIAHSRGSSVTSSALGNPIYNAEFLAETKAVAARVGMDAESFVHPQELPNAGNEYHIMLLAPAISWIDFCDLSNQPRPQPLQSCTYRKLAPVVKSIRHTVNSKDWVLVKVFGLQERANPTSLGTTASVSRNLAARTQYPITRYCFTPPLRIHKFPEYVEHPAFAMMLQDEGIAAVQAGQEDRQAVTKNC